MINIVLCENNTVCRRIIINILDRIRPLRNFSITEAPSDSKFISHIKKSSPDIILMDENFKTSRTNCGHESARLLNEHFSTAEIIYLTSNPDLISRRSDSVSISDWILKPAEYENVKNTLLSSMIRISPYDELVFHCGRSDVSLNPDDIIYFEADRRSTNIRTKEKSYVSSENIGTILKKLPENSFFQTHRTYILNMDHIARVENDTVEMTNGEFVLLSRHRKKDFIKKITT